MNHKRRAFLPCGYVGVLSSLIPTTRYIRAVLCQKVVAQNSEETREGLTYEKA